MASNFYTNVQCVGNYILYRGVKDGKRVRAKIEYSPTVFVPSKNATKYTTLHGEYLEEMNLGGIRDTREFIARYRDVESFHIYGNSRFEYNYISDNHPTDVDWDGQSIRVAFIDIEVGSENGFPEPATASEPITAITIKYLDGKTLVFGCGEYKPVGNEIYMNCKDEYTLCKKFLQYWVEDYPDIISGWNIKFFDFPYLVNRLSKIIGEDETKKLSPWNYIRARTVTMMNKEQIAYELVGVSMIDYLELYRKYAPGGASQESYRLDHIAHVELKKRKLSYDEVDNLHQLYITNFQKFIEYNIQDVVLVEELEDKLKLLELTMTLAYDSKTNYEDVFTQVRMWDILIYNYLRSKNIQIPQREEQEKGGAFEGAYVKDPIIGMHEWMASFDLNSLYPHLIMQYNISPETIINASEYNDYMRSISSQANVQNFLDRVIDTSRLREYEITVTPNGQFFRTDFQGFLPEMMESMYNGRSVYKKKAIEAKKELEKETDPDKRFVIEKRIARYNNLQLAKKVCLNSAYGALGNQYFRFYDIRQAMGITLSGQLSIKWIEKKLNQYINNVLKTDGVDYVVASDTDSIYLNLGGLVNKVYANKQESPSKIIEFMDKVCEDKIQPYIDKSYQELATYVNAYAQKMQMKREALASKGIWTAKKRYILNVYNNEGVQYAEPKIKVMGLEMVKSSTPAVVRDKMYETIKLMINGTEQDIQDYIGNFRKEFKTLPIEDVAFPRGIKGLQKYSDSTTIYKKGTPIHVKGALIYNTILTKKGLTKKVPIVKEGEKIRYAYLKIPNPIGQTVITFPGRLAKEVEMDEYIDFDMQFEKAYLEPIKSILDCIGWQAEKVNTLEAFFV